LREFGLSEEAEMITYGAFTVESGQEMTRAVLGMNPRPTAVFAGNNFIAIGMMQALNQAGVRVPEEVSVVGFDDLPASLLITPFLTVAAQPAYQMGREAMKLLVKRLKGDESALPQEVVLPVELIERQSVLKR
jgi:LacI family transcriptional regulator